MQKIFIDTSSPTLVVGFGKGHSKIARVIKGIRTKALNKAKIQATWGTYGKGGNEPLRRVRLIDCATDHLQAILATQPHVGVIECNGYTYADIIRAILKDRHAPEKAI